jgi:hypothetical protein
MPRPAKGSAAAKALMARVRSAKKIRSVRPVKRM